MKCCYLEVLREETLTTKEILDGMTQVAAGVEYLHHIGIIHCDLAARNISFSKTKNSFFFQLPKYKRALFLTVDVFTS